jgi:molybdopterin-guanine dinucleotide biosynthesis protein
VQYKFTVSRNITILRGDSATGKTTLIEMIAAHQRGGERSGVEIRSDKPCVVLTEQNWELMLSAPKLRMIGWDIAVTESYEAVLMEGNRRPTPVIYQSDLVGKWEALQEMLSE